MPRRTDRLEVQPVEREAVKLELSLVLAPNYPLVLVSAQPRFP